MLYSHREYFIFTPWIFYIHSVNISYSHRDSLYSYWDLIVYGDGDDDYDDDDNDDDDDEQK